MNAVEDGGSVYHGEAPHGPSHPHDTLPVARLPLIRSSSSCTWIESLAGELETRFARRGDTDTEHP